MMIPRHGGFNLREKDKLLRTYPGGEPLVILALSVAQ